LSGHLKQVRVLRATLDRAISNLLCR
jgi:hypothetical protein